MIDRLGQKLGNYHLIRLLGRGGFASVYLGDHIHLNTQAAIKILDVQLTIENLKQFRNEANTIAQLKHPHIVQVLDYDIENGSPFLVMTYAPNGTLRQRHPRGVQVPLQDVVIYVNQVADALQFAHNNKRIHRDVKPENMLLGLQNEILLSDFGIAVEAHSSLSQPLENIVGTMAYMAPEQIDGKPSIASDQYALGISVYEWLSGTCPFNGSTTEIAQQHLKAEPPSLQGRAKALPSAVEQVVLKALAKVPSQRFAGVQEFANALEQAIKPQQQINLPGRSNTIPISPTDPTLNFANRDGQGNSNPSLQQNQKPSQNRNRLAPTQSQTEPLYTLPIAEYPPRQGQFLAWSSDGIRIAVLTANGSAQIFDTTTGLQLSNKGQDPLFRSAIGAMAWSPDGKRVASSSMKDDGRTMVWNVVTGEEIFVHQKVGRRVVTKESDYYVDAAVQAIAWSPDGAFIACGYDDGAIQILDAANRGGTYRNGVIPTYKSPSPVSNIAWSSDGRYIASSDKSGTVYIRDISTGFLAHKYVGHLTSRWKKIVLSPEYLGSYILAWSPDGESIASGASDRTIHIWKIPRGQSVWDIVIPQPLIYREHQEAVSTLAWSPNGAYIASGSNDGTVHIWEASTGRNISTYSTVSNKLFERKKKVFTLAWSSDGRRVASASNRIVYIWQAI